MTTRLFYDFVHPCIVRGILFIIALALASVSVADPPATAPATAPASTPMAPAARRVLHLAKLTPPKDPYVSDAEIGQAIEKGQTWLMGQFQGGKIVDFVAAPQPNVKDDDAHYHSAGANALAVYALYQCGLASHKAELDPKNPFMTNLLDTMQNLPVDDSISTYTRGIRATAFAAVNRPEDRGIISLDACHLMDSCHGGAYTYGIAPAEYDTYQKKGYLKPSNAWDNSNSQYGLLGVWSAAEVGAEISEDYWKVVEKHWTETQQPDGQWFYNLDPARAQGAITWDLAGIASLFVCHDYIDVAKAGATVGREPFSPPLVRGLAWLEDGEHAAMEYGTGYARYGLERVGLASGFKYFGKHDWYREQATKIIALQQADGSWDPPKPHYFTTPRIETSYNLLFLARGRHALLMNKLRYEHFWCNRPRDLASLAKFAYKELEIPFNWQVVPVTHDWMDWTDAPVLYIAGHEAPKFTDADYAKIRSFAESGGLVFTQADGGSPAFNTYVEKVFVRNVFPDFELAKVPETHSIYTVYEPMKTKPLPPLEMVSNGARALMVHSPRDLAINWQQRATKTHPDSFQLGLNLFVYAGGKSDFKNRLSSSYIPEPPADQLSATLKVARVKYPLPTWDPEPYAWKHLSNWMAWQTSVAVKTQAVEMEHLGELNIDEFPLAHLTGTNSYTPTDAQIQSIKAYVSKGGTLLVDPCSPDFTDSIGKMLARAFPDDKFKRLPATHPAYTFDASPAMDIAKPQLRPYAANLMGHSPPPPQLLTTGHGQVIYSQIDLTNSLLGSRTWGIMGYDSPWAMQFVKNLVLATAQGNQP